MNIERNKEARLQDFGKPMPPEPQVPPDQREGESAIGKLPALLRLAGAMVLIASALTFLFNEWGSLSHLERYFSFLGFTSLLSLCGFLCGIRFGDAKSARTFLAVAAAVVPIHFTQLGAILFNQFGNPLLSYPAWATWTAPNPHAALITVGVGLLALIPIVYVSFSALMRPKAKLLTAAYLVANAFLLIPVRSPDIIGPLGFMLALLLAGMELKVLRENMRMRTLEGTFIRVMMTVPVILLFARTFQLYMTSALFLTGLLGVLSLLLFVVFPTLTQSESLGRTFQAVSVVPVAATWASFLVYSNNYLPIEYPMLVPAFVIPLALIYVLMSVVALGSGAGYRRLAAYTACVPLVCHLFVGCDLFSSLLTVGTCLVLASYGYLMKDKIILFSSASGFVLSLAYHLRYATELYSFSPWVALASIGVATVGAACFIERYQQVITLRLHGMREEIGAW